MSKCSDERIGESPGKPSFNIPLSSIKTIIQMIKCAFVLPEIPLPPITALELSIGARFRPGISKIDSLSRVLTKCAGADIKTGPNNDGSSNKSNIAKRIIVDEIVDELLYKARIEIVIDALAINIPITGSFIPPSTAVTGTAINTSPIKCLGIIR